jgi:tryptophan halogenase
VPQAAAPLAALLRAAPLQGLEHSFKLAPGMLISQRLLGGIALSAVDSGWLLSACREIGFPDPELDAFQRHARQADIVHFGYEAGPEGLLYKVYLEFPGRIASAAGPTLLHLAWKWYADRPDQRAIARYIHVPGLNLDEIRARVGRLASAPGAGLLADIAEQAAARSPEPMMYLEVSEEGNPRMSFDLNVHASGLRLCDIEPQLRGLQSWFKAPIAAFDAFCASARDSCLGHVSGGQGRSGADFATFYLDMSSGLA